ncbi:VRR-NUC domain-containing protein [Hominifimenecus sp. rT4P-3]|uniref:VRR-NUC domain-containing protein n=1 Tax=Hominifimenecus sp. rT4P-3 TaxID=3242979 RepID=UPI003DA1CB11
MIRESEVEKILVEQVKRLGGRAYKWVSPGNDGVPDRIVILPEQPAMFVELKTDIGQLSGLQQIQIKRLRELDQPTYVVYGVPGLVQFFRDIGQGIVAQRIETRYLL